MHPDPNSRSAALFARAQAVLPGGNTRHSLFTTPYPVYVQSGQGCEIVDVDGRRYIDCANNMSANIHGHRRPEIMEAVARQLERIVSVALPTEAEIALAELIVSRVASVEQIRFTNSGSEALMFAVRAARAFTGRPMIAKIEGGYHGAYDALDVSNHPTPDQWGDPDAPATVRESAGFTEGGVADTLVLPVNRVQASRALIRAHADRLAAVVIDPLVSRMGFLPLTSEFLTMVREETTREGALLIFDEVFSFRLGLEGAQGVVGIRPDLTTFGKIIGGGFPIGALGGRADVMAVFDRRRADGPKVEHSGTFNANPVSMAAGLAAMQLLDEAAFARLTALGDRLRGGLAAILKDLGLPGQAMGRGSLVSLLPHAAPFSDYRGFAAGMAASPLAPRLPEAYFGLVNIGVMPVFPSGYILSTAMDESTIDTILDRAGTALRHATETALAS